MTSDGRQGFHVHPVLQGHGGEGVPQGIIRTYRTRNKPYKTKSVLDSVYRKYMESSVTILYSNSLTFHVADLCKFTYYYPLFEIALFGNMRKSFEFL